MKTATDYGRFDEYIKLNGLMRKNGFGSWCGYMFIRPMTLEQCGKDKYHFCWLDKTIGEMGEEDEDESEE